MSSYVYRVYLGTEDQDPDAVMEVLDGTSATPAYRGVAYIVFEDFPITDFGNRLPQFSFEVERRVPTLPEDALERSVTAVTMIPGSGEFVYDLEPVFVDDDEGNAQVLNAITYRAEADAHASLNDLRTTLAETRHIGLVVSWFGSDLRAG